jgi:uncharacterized protein
MQWVIKTTKLCNLRCKYCYEWDHLSNPARMSEAVWRHTLIAIREYAMLTSARCGYDIPIDIIWHGGEPTLLPPAYIKEVIALQHELVPGDWFAERRMRNCLQTNLYSVSEDHLDLFEEHNFELGVSLDFAKGVRLTAGGRPTEDAVMANIKRLQHRRLPFSIITVLAAHTVDAIERIFDEIVGLNKPLRLLPLFSGPSARPMAGVSIDQPAIIDAMMVLFDLWISAGMTPRIDPFDQCMRTVVLSRLGLARPRQDRTFLGNDVFVVDRDGSLECDTNRDIRRFGNIAETPIAEIVDGAIYRHLMDDEVRLKESVCASCAFLGPCDTSPIVRNFDGHVAQDCTTEKYLLPLMDAHLESRGFFDGEFHRAAHALTAAHAATAFGATISS